MTDGICTGPPTHPVSARGGPGGAAPQRTHVCHGTTRSISKKRPYVGPIRRERQRQGRTRRMQAGWGRWRCLTSRQAGEGARQRGRDHQRRKAAGRCAARAMSGRGRLLLPRAYVQKLSWLSPASHSHRGGVTTTYTCARRGCRPQGHASAASACVHGPGRDDTRPFLSTARRSSSPAGHSSPLVSTGAGAKHVGHPPCYSPCPWGSRR